MIEPKNTVAAALPLPAVADLEMLQHKSFSHFLHETNPDNGLVIDKTAEGWPASIAATGLALESYLVAVERKFMPRSAAVERTLATLRFFWNSLQGPEPDATGYQGFYYHFLDMQTGRRAWQCEPSTVDSTFLLAGALTAGIYFDAANSDELEIRTLADALYRRADWQWAQDGGATVTHGWKPECGFLKYRWEGYDEAMLLYILGLGLPTHPLPEAATPRGLRLTDGKTVTDMTMRPKKSGGDASQTPLFCCWLRSEQQAALGIQILGCGRPDACYYQAY